MKQHSEDYKIAAVEYYLGNAKTYEEVCIIFKCSIRSLKRWVSIYKNGKQLVSKQRICKGYKIDEKLIELNDDYAIERKSALKEIRISVLKEETFMTFLKSKGKIGGQHKFPRVLKGKLLEEWKLFISKHTDDRSIL